MDWRLFCAWQVVWDRQLRGPNTILNTKMTLPQLVGLIDVVVSPEHSSGDRSHEFQIASSKNASIEFSKAEYARSTKAELAHSTPSSRSSKYAQSQKLSSLSQKYRIFPQLLHICMVLNVASRQEHWCLTACGCPQKHRQCHIEAPEVVDYPLEECPVVDLAGCRAVDSIPFVHHDG